MLKMFMILHLPPIPYRIGESEWNGIKCYSLAQEHHASRWQNVADYTAKLFKFFEDIGMYVYHKTIVSTLEMEWSTQC